MNTIPTSQHTLRKDSCASESPKLAAIMSHLHYEFLDYKYTVYRCAAKIVTLQKVFHTTNISFKLVLAILERHQLKDADANLMVPPFQLTAIVHDIFSACEKLGHLNNVNAYCLETATNILSNFLWNIFDPKRSHSISLLEIKVTFLLLSKLYAFEDLVKECYQLLVDTRTKCVPRLKFEYLLDALTKIISYIGEGVGYGAHNVPLIMEQCYARCPNPNGLTEYHFKNIWTSNGTRFIIYANLIALIKRIEDTRKLIHNNICAVCKMDKIIGIRFKCQICKDLSLCMKCFASGYVTNKHAIGHRMFEVFTEDEPPKRLISHYFSKLCNMFLLRNIEERQQWFSNSDESTANVNNETELFTIVDMHGSSKETIVKQPMTSALEKIEKYEPSVVLSTDLSSNSSHISERIQLIIEKLLEQNDKIEEQLDTVKVSSPEKISKFLTAHQIFLIHIISEMRNLTNSAYTSNYLTSSTPNRSLVEPPQKNVTKDFRDGNLSHSMNGADLNRSYLDANKSDYSVADLSSWFNRRRASISQHSAGVQPPLNRLSGLTEVDVTDGTDLPVTEMYNFKLLLNKVKEIVDDPNSESIEPSLTIQSFKNSEEIRRKST